MLARPCRYFPLANGKYEVSAGLRPLGTDFGNGERDGKLFQFDDRFPSYREAKLRARSERLEKYHPPSVDLDPAASAAVLRFMIETLVREWPEHFRLHGNLQSDEAKSILECVLTSERIVFDPDCRLVSVSSIAGPAHPPYRDLLDAIASQIQEDVSIWRRSETGREWLAALHLCFPNHWSAEEKIGRPFNEVHGPVAGFEKLARGAPALVDMMIAKGPFVRFAWGIATDRELNHHPLNERKGRAFDPAAPGLELRVERQTLTPFPEAGASLFTIRTSFLDCANELSSVERVALSRAIDSMDERALAYKGLTASREAIQSWLGSLPKT